MAKGFSLDDYKDVAERITEFYERFPEGSLTRKGDPDVMNMDGRLFVVYTALAYRTPDDPQPATGTAWEPFPGPTQYTKDSELMNAETAAWGRAIIASGISSKKIASRQEVRNRRDDGAPAENGPLNGAQYERLTTAFKQAGTPFEFAHEQMDKAGVPVVEHAEELDPSALMGRRVALLKAQQAEVLISELTRLAREQSKEKAA